MLIFSYPKIVTVPFRSHCASVRFCDATFERWLLPLWGEAVSGLLQPRFRVHGREPQRSGHKIAVTKLMISIDKRKRCHELARGSRERSTSGVALPNIRRRLSG